MYLENKILHFGPSVIFFFSFKILLRYIKTNITGMKHPQGGDLPAPHIPRGSLSWIVNERERPSYLGKILMHSYVHYFSIRHNGIVIFIYFIKMLTKKINFLLEIHIKSIYCKKVNLFCWKQTKKFSCIS